MWNCEICVWFLCSPSLLLLLLLLFLSFSFFACKFIPLRMRVLFDEANAVRCGAAHEYSTVMWFQYKLYTFSWTTELKSEHSIQNAKINVFRFKINSLIFYLNLNENSNTMAKCVLISFHSMVIYDYWIWHFLLIPNIRYEHKLDNRSISLTILKEQIHTLFGTP